MFATIEMIVVHIMRMISAEARIESLCDSQRRRLRFMESLVYWEGSVQRDRICSVFQVSENHLSRDFRLYRNLFPGNLIYEPSRKRYEPMPKFQPRMTSGSAAEYLGSLRLSAEVHGNVLDLPGPQASDVVPLHSGGVGVGTLRAVTQAIAEGRSVAGTYQSMREPDPTSVCLWPRALVFSGYRWHARAYESDGGKYGDFVLARLKISSRTNAEESESMLSLPKDTAWETRITVEVQPAAHWSVSQQEAIGREYGMTHAKSGWRWSVRLRECLVPYFFLLHRLDVQDKESRIALVDPGLLKRYRFARKRR